ncbi:MAG TPA: hypothetical protein EYO04_00530 [Candidatus Marinimicrobia bacterium]|jgi:site-specific DNA-methyltransferase (adenine-specific)/site-specific DNA-methyltransferase (cytosine-N4-specific)|nr:site-specific DNA-methyltransferase [Candidatus Neomarinimicrobiota bacterium]MEE2917923.1 DNA methyltransferase [Candidatus Neomarinimicrobiota bacterium]HIA84503.1 hypothetical protein [Candidatus Neomarinimicrobiota bacterium]|tara:strand:- start:214 stop:486 length:273 start_codon:yes stop_codon:yes gene_type:complete
MSKMQEVKHNPTDRIIVGDSRQLLTQFSDNTFLMCVTSPPYWGLRDYGIEDQIAAEPTHDEYINDIVAIFSEVRRTLKDDHTLWLTTHHR